MKQSSPVTRSHSTTAGTGADRSPHAWFAVSAVFHCLGPSFGAAFPSVGVLGVAWLRIASAAAIFAPWTRPWRSFARADRLLALLPATATVVGVIVRAQIPSLRDLAGLALVMTGVALHRPAPPGTS
jgi:threonine/homoserine efflux transporter RhtA